MTATRSSRGRPQGPAVFGRPAAFALLPLACWLLSPGAWAQSAPGAGPETIVITANRTPQPLSSVLADISVIDHDTIQRAGVTGVADLLARLPGVEFARNGGPGAATSVFIRGSESRHTAVYIDGVRVDSQATGGAIWEQIPLDQIDRIEVLRGPAAAVYGSDAVAGVVQLFTKRGQGALKPTASVTLGSFNTTQLQAGVSGSAQAFDYSLSAAHGQSDGFDSQTSAAVGHNPDKDGWRRNSVQARAGFQFDPRQRVDASLLASNLRSQYDGFTPGFDDLNHHTLRTGSLAWQGRWSEGSTTRAQVGQSDSSYESDPSYYRTETTLRNLSLQHDQRFGSNLLTGTLERRDDELRNPGVGPTLEGRRHQNAIGLGWRTDVGAFGLQAHARRDDDSEFGGKTTGSLAVGWAFAPQWRATASAASSFRVPTLYQRFSAYGNATLVPEAGRNVELGLRWAVADSEASLTAWRNRVGHLINFGAPGPCVDAYGCYVNIGRSQLDGVTLAGRSRLAGVTVHGSLDWHDPKNLDTNTVLARRAKRLGTFGAETEFAGWIVGAEVQAAGLRYDDAANTQRLGGYALVNLSISRLLMPGLTLEGRIDNMADKTYELARTYATAGRTGQLMLRWVTP